jgi:hypothetical protein
MNESIENSDLKRKVDKRLERIANVLLLNASFTDNIGLLNGKMGIAIFFYHYSRYTGKKKFEDYAGELIDEIYENIRPGTPVNFEDGLTGIGWGIEYLVKNNFVQADTDEALSEIDNAIYRTRLNSPILIHDGKDLFGYGLYYIKRLTGREISDDDLNTLIKKYHLIFLTDECERILVKNLYKGFKIESLSVNTLNSFIWFILEMHRLAIFPFNTEKVLQALPCFIQSSLLSSDDIAGKAQMQCLTGLLLPRINNIVSRDLLREQLNKSKQETNYNELTEEIAVDCFIKNSWQQIVFNPYVTSEQKPSDCFNNVFSFIDNEGNWTRRLDNLGKNNLGLIGLAGLGIGLLRVQSIMLSAKHMNKRINLYETK